MIQAFALASNVLLVHGGYVPQAHKYVQNTVRLLERNAVPFEILSVADVTADLLKSKHYSAVIVSDYSALKSSSAASAAVAGEGTGVVFLYVDAGVSIEELGVTASTGTRMPKVESADDSAFRLLRPDTVLVEHSPLYGRLLPESKDPLLRAAGVPIAARGAYGAARAVWNGMDQEDHWVPKLLLLDALTWVSHGAVVPATDRWTTVDVDDVFQPSYLGTVKIQAGDVEAMRAFQKDVSGLFDGDFKFNLGFNSGFYGQNAAPAPFDDKAGDAAFVAGRESFRWFDHFPHHEAATSLTREDLVANMVASRDWAGQHDILRLMGKYAVSPYHSGIFPAYAPLYDAWREVWGIKYTSAMIESGFRHDDVVVAVRRNCGSPCSPAIYSFSQFSQAESEANGENVIASLVAESPVSIFMTHQSNFARDRLALVAFGKAFKTISEKTRLKLRTDAPENLAAVYAKTFLGNRPPAGREANLAASLFGFNLKPRGVAAIVGVIALVALVLGKFEGRLRRRRTA